LASWLKAREAKLMPQSRRPAPLLLRLQTRAEEPS